MWSLKITQGRGCWQGDKLTSKKSAQHKTCSTARQHKDTGDANKIIEYLDSENPFDVTHSVTLHSHDIGIVAPKSGTVDMQNS